MQAFSLASRIAGSAFFILIVFSNIAAAGGAADLPRAMGPFKLRMSSMDFAKLARITPQACEGCLAKETYAALSAEQIKQISPSLAADNGMDFFFFNGRLYRINVGTEASDVREVHQRLTSLYGNSQVYELRNGTSYLKWDDGGTVVTANFRTATQQVFAMNYFDWDIKTERDNFASLAAGQATSRQ